MKIAIVIVNFRTPQLVLDCLDSLAKEQGKGVVFEVFVGDAASGDGSVETINTHISDKMYGWATCSAIGSNGGFAFGNNTIIQQHVLPEPSFEYAHFLNPDTYIHPGAVRALASFLRDHPQAGAAGSRLENPDGSPRAYGFRFPAPWREFFRGARLSVLDRVVPRANVKIQDLNECREVDWVTGASFMVPRDVLETVGLMDDRYFLYFEEVDFMSRIRKAGYQVWHVPESRVVHLAGQATGVRGGEIQKTSLPAYWLHSRWKFFSRRYGWAGAVLANLLFLSGDLVYRLHRTVLRRPVDNPPGLWRSYLSHGFSMPPDRSC